MEKIQLKFLGTGNAIPTRLRNHSSILLSYKDESILVDCGEGTQRQFKIAGISPCRLTRILITHWHGDHILGLPGLLQTLAMSDYNGVLKVYGPIGTKKFFSLIESIIFGIRIKTEIHEVAGGVFIDEREFMVEAKEMSHGISCNAYSFMIKDKLRLDKKKLRKFKLPNSPILKELQAGRDIAFNGMKIKSKDATYLEKGRKIVFILDSEKNENALVLSKGADLLISEATFSSNEEENARETKHMTAKDAATIAKKAGAKRLLLTHLSQRYEHNPKEVLREARKVFKDTALVKDFDEIVI